jgi:PAS domain S-box-containing protein
VAELSAAKGRREGERLAELVRMTQAACAGAAEGERWFRSIADDVPEIVWTTDAEGAVDYVNHKFIDYTGLTFAEACGSGWARAVHPDDRAASVEHWLRATATGSVFERELRFCRRRDGTHRWHVARGQPLRDQAGRIRMWSGLSVDIEDYKRLEGLQQELVGAVAHDLRSPLSVILGRADLLLHHGDLPSAGRESVTRIRANAGRMTAIVRDLLDFTRVRVGGSLALAPAPMDLAATCSAIVDDLRAQAPGRTISFSTEGDAQGLWDRDRLERVVENLVTNALKYGDPHGPVRVTCAGREAEVTISVHNIGRPIPDEVLPTLFEPFRRGVDVEVPGAISLGLGLHIAQAIVRAHGGTLVASSTAEDGTTFMVRLPRGSRQQALAS